MVFPERNSPHRTTCRQALPSSYPRTQSCLSLSTITSFVLGRCSTKLDKDAGCAYTAYTEGLPILCVGNHVPHLHVVDELPESCKRDVWQHVEVDAECAYSKLVSESSFESFAITLDGVNSSEMLVLTEKFVCAFNAPLASNGYLTRGREGC